MAKQNLFVSSIAYSTTEDSLREFFGQIGEVAYVKIITDHESGRSKGFGFVEFADDENNQKAIDQLNGKDLDGREVSVNLARPREERPRREFAPRDGGNRGNDRGDRGNGGGSFRQRSW